MFMIYLYFGAPGALRLDELVEDRGWFRWLEIRHGSWVRSNVHKNLHGENIT